MSKPSDKRRPEDSVLRSSGVITVPISSGSIQVPVLTTQGSLPRAPSDVGDDWLRYRCRIELDGQDEIEGIIVAFPGSPLWARVEIEFLDACQLTSCRARLRFRATGSGSPETHEFVRQTLAEGDVGAGHLIKRSLRMPLPENAPISYEGVYVKIIWSVAVEFLGPDGRLIEEEVPLIVRPRPMDWRPGDSHATAAALAGELPEEPPDPDALGTHNGESVEVADPGLEVADAPEDEVLVSAEVQDAPEPPAPRAAPPAPAPPVPAPPVPAPPQADEDSLSGERVPEFYAHPEDTEPAQSSAATVPAQPERRVRDFYMGSAISDERRLRNYDHGDASPAGEDEDDAAPGACEPSPQPPPPPAPKKPRP